MLIESNFLSSPDGMVMRRYENIRIADSLLAVVPASVPEGHSGVVHCKHQLTHIVRRMEYLECKSAALVTCEGQFHLPLQVEMVVRLGRMGHTDAFEVMDSSLQLRQRIIDQLIEQGDFSDAWYQQLLDFEKAFYDDSGIASEMRTVAQLADSPLLDRETYAQMHEAMVEKAQVYVAFHDQATEHGLRVLRNVFGLSITGQA